MWLLYLLGSSLLNGMLTSEFVRKTQLESDQIAAQQIQQTLIPEKVEQVGGYDVETFYKPFRDVGGDYFDMIELPGSRTLFAVADVSGKGMSAALLAANIQALVRSIANVERDPLELARQINKHLSRYTPSDCFATAVFAVLSRDSGELTYVNAGHNAPMVWGPGLTTLLEATGIPLGLLSDAEYEAGTAIIPPGGALLLFTDGLTDSIGGQNPENRLRDALADSSGRTMSKLKSLVDPKFNEDDVTILLVKRTAASSSGGVPELEWCASSTFTVTKGCSSAGLDLGTAWADFPPMRLVTLLHGYFGPTTCLIYTFFILLTEAWSEDRVSKERVVETEAKRM
jgi:serine phosphatase RsbU (regulator of sigma subunit)